jgi:hypothetical protein
LVFDLKSFEPVRLFSEGFDHVGSEFKTEEGWFNSFNREPKSILDLTSLLLRGHLRELSYK